MNAPLLVRTMTLDDVPDGLRLCAQAGWNQTPDDWQRMLEWQPDGCFVAEADGRVAGSVTTTVFGERLAWVGMMLVDEAMRRRGIGRTLLSAATEWLEQARGVQSVALDATPLGKTMYDGMGFADAYTLQRFAGTAPALSAPDQVRPLEPDDVPAVAALDATAFGVSRQRVLRDLVSGYPAGAFRVERDGATAGYACLRPGARSWYLGPLVARDAETAALLMRAALSHVAGQPVALVAPDPNDAAGQLARHHGLAPQRPLIRMARGQPLPDADLPLVYAIAAPEIG